MRLAPFQLLATERATYHDRPHGWHLDLADRLVAAAPGLIQGTRRLVVDTGDAGSVAAGVAWWTELTAAGGEGMVVKPLANLSRGPRGAWPSRASRCAAGSTCGSSTGRTTPSRATCPGCGTAISGRKRSLALREYALGLEALDRAARGEPLWRVHEAVFAVLALESEPVDPRL